ncbi:MAG TPA: hypothetical protein VL503_05995 [Candidatus Omnitrophota bacterium]|nr:hypothetical protein [Candidatus Omnitrophota bacterium]
MGKKHRSFRISLPPVVGRVAKSVLKSKLLMVLVGLFVLGFIAGKQSEPDPTGAPFQELFENLSVVSYRDSPSDSASHFMVELSARGKIFREYDVDEQRFVEPARGRDYGRMIGATRYEPLVVRGHVDRGFWLELSNSKSPEILPDQFQEMYQTTLDYVKPVSVIASIAGTLSGYSVGYRAGTWGTSLANPAVQKRVLATSGVGRMITREAWRRVLLEPVVMGHESDPERFAAARETQRIYTNFFRLALADSNDFIHDEARRLDAAGYTREAIAMLEFTYSALRAADDTVHLESADFRAVEEWASLIAHRGHWAPTSIPASGEARVRYLGTLAYYGLTPVADDAQRVWVGPRVLVKDGEEEGFVADEIPSIRAACPLTWQDWLKHDTTGLSSNEWTAQWMKESKQLAQMVSFGKQVVRQIQPAR